jgi:UDP-N-acetylglucosamine--N-acetylmuramyl-(pentapeptide) pyrophosphoryl-undecaprenol N-acetylglucosamine transferase
MLERQRTRLPQKLQQRYFIKEWIDDEDLFWLYQTAFCAVSRAGANSTQELAVAGLPAVLIPLPSSRHDEQRKNAHWLAQVGGAVVLEQAHFSSETLVRALEKVQTFEATMRAGMQAVELPENAAERLYALAESTAKSS